MARAYQRLRVFGKKKNARTTGKMVWLRARTGYYNVTINGKHYYYNQKEEVARLKDVDMHDYFPSTSDKKGIVVVRRK